MKMSKLICLLTAGAFLFTAGPGSDAYGQKKAETNKSRMVSPAELKGLSPQPEPPDRGIRKPDRKLNSCDPDKAKDVDPKSQ